MAANKNRKATKRTLPSSGTSPFASKKKRPQTPIIAEDIDSACSSPASYSTIASEVTINNSGSTVPTPAAMVFKDPNFEHSGINNSKKRIWKNLKQILTIERGLPWKEDDPTYGSIDAPPSFKPAKKYSDLSGQQSKYKDPRTGLQFSTSSEFSTSRNLPSDIVTGYLSLRKAAPT
ncbi:predicted protein [Nematostella vectensis]|uniref:Vps72/YL1 C-terminal domain-containing protein n=1 Tax=Nematostella vectensis TaxID=45351 RepID=A7RRL5_NEMVE|nr:INO80 complex subunit C [Nematostella vectensis]EDO45850.1 predicted protein [Nematostella vectensis]|eukprot:XP_001637913.1 predicted protein [Nematostella vectensis]